MNKLALALLCFSVATTTAFVIPQSSSSHTTTCLHAKGFSRDSNRKTTVSPPPPPSEATPLTPTSPTPAAPDLSQGKRALEEMRRERAEKRNAELRAIKQVQGVDEMLRESPQAAAIPEKVAQRMGKRMLPFVGIPLFGGMGVFVGFWYMATYRDMSFEPALVAASTIAVLVIGLLVCAVFCIVVF